MNHNVSVGMQRIYTEIVSLSALKACNGKNWLRGTAISLKMLISPLTYAVYPWSVQCDVHWCKNSDKF